MTREYIGSGGMRLHLDEPLSPEMAKQVKRGHLVPADGVLPDAAQAVDKSLVVSHGSEAATATRAGTHRRTPGEKPGEDASAGVWATYAVALGLEATQASTLSLAQLQEWVAAHEEDAPEVERPAKNAPVADWRAYAAARGMEDAESATKAECQDYVQVLDDAVEE